MNASMNTFRQKIIGGFIAIAGVAILFFGAVMVMAGQIGGAGHNNAVHGVINIFDESDFPAPVAGIINLTKSEIYELHGIVDVANRFVVADGLTIHFQGGNAILDGLNYTGTGTFFTGNDASIDFFIGTLQSFTGGTLLDWTPSSTSFGTVFIEFIVLLGWDDLGDVTNIDTFEILNSALVLIDKGFELNNIRGSFILLNQWNNWNDVGGTFLSYSGVSENITMVSQAFATQITESVIFFDPTFTITSATITGNDYDGSIGGSFYEVGLTGGITEFADAGGGTTTVTSSAHGLSNGNTVFIEDTTNYDGGHTVSGVLTNTFVIDTAFVADDATGNFNSGSLDQSFPSITVSGNGNITDSRTLAHMNMVTNTTETVISAIDTPVKMEGNFTSLTKERFDINGDGKITYTGLEGIEVMITATFRVDVVTGNNIETSYYFGKNGTVDTQSQHTVLLGNNDFEMVPFTDAVGLVTGDFLEFFIENNSGTGNYIVDRVHLIIE